MSGLFISFEGTDGSGKTTQIDLLKNYLTKKSYSVLIVREPGGTPIGERIRDILSDVNHIKMYGTTEALLYAAARAQLLKEVILPNLKQGSIVISDRFLDSSIVYQGVGRNLGKENILKINQFSIDEIVPDITFLLDVQPSFSLKRKKKVVELDRIENEKYYFHKKVYDGYLELHRENPSRIKKIDGNRPIKKIHNDIVEHIENFISNTFRD